MLIYTRYRDLGDGVIEVTVGNASWSYTFGADGSYALDWEAWSHFRKYDPCPDEERRDGFCVKTRAETGRLHRYRNVVRAGQDGYFLYIDDPGLNAGLLRRVDFSNDPHDYLVQHN